MKHWMRLQVNGGGSTHARAGRSIHAIVSVTREGMHHHSMFARQVCAALRRIPRGRVVTYGDVARALGKPYAARAVAHACAANPEPVRVPCHRVVMTSGALGGYSGPGGIVRKAALLRAEGVGISRGRILEFDAVRLRSASCHSLVSSASSEGKKRFARPRASASAGVAQGDVDVPL